MSAEIGHFALILACMAALIQSTLPLMGTARGHAPWMESATGAALVQILLLGVAFACLVNGFVGSDFSLAIVHQNSHTDKPLLYKITGTWGNHEGSLLLWVLVLALFGGAVGVFGRNLPLAFRARVLAVQGMIGVMFMAFMLFTSNPFIRIYPVPKNGTGLNPLLQDPGLAFHPPMLYMGYVGFSMAFSFAVAALLEGKVNAAWGRWVRPWTLLAWGFLTAGIALGSWWAYYELGWGGWWFWDPVENASFMPWLAGTALLHSSIMVEKRDTMKGWTILLSIVTFSFSLLGTFIVRSGVLTSVHAFALDPERGVFILVILMLVVGGSLVLFAWRGPMLRNQGLFQPVSREGSLLFNNLIMSTAAASVMLGTFYPLILEGITGDKISVGAPFFNAVFVPLMLPMMAAMAIGPLLGWKRGYPEQVIRVLWPVLVITAVAALGLYVYNTDVDIMAVLAMVFGVWLSLGVMAEVAGRIRLFSEPLPHALSRLRRIPRSGWAMVLAHLGLAIAVLGMAGVSGWKEEVIRSFAVGEVAVVGGYTVRYDGMENGVRENYRYGQGILSISRDGVPVTVLKPENRFYPVRAMTTTEAAIHPLFWGDLYAAMGEINPADGKQTVRLYWNPMVSWMWAGALLVVLATLLGLSDRRYRLGIAKPAHGASRATGRVS